jgi:cell division transport system permease protein
MRYFIFSAFRNLWESKMTSLFTLVTLSVALGFLGAYMAIFMNMNAALGAMTERFPLTVYLTDDISPGQLDALKKRIGDDPSVAGLEYTSKKKAYELFKETLKDNASILENLGDNPLPASFDISIKPGTQPGAVDAMLDDVRAMPGVGEIQYLRDEASKLRSFMASIKSAGLVLGLGVLLGVVFISYSTLRLAVLNHIDEINVMKLMGATRLFIMTPFLLEGALQGLASAVLSLGLLYSLLRAFSDASAMVLLTPTGLSFLPVWAWSGILAAGTLLGLTGSFFAFGRTLRM